MTTLYKLTNEDGQTRKHTQWGIGVTHRATGKNDWLYTDGVIHAYEDLIVGAFIYPTHVPYHNPRLWLSESEVVSRDPLSVGVKSLTTLYEIEMPTVTTEMRIRLAILATLKVVSDAVFVAWANGWISGEDRTEESAARLVDRAACAGRWAALAAQEAAQGSTYAAELAALAVEEAVYVARMELIEINLPELARLAMG